MHNSYILLLTEKSEHGIPCVAETGWIVPLAVTGWIVPLAVTGWIVPLAGRAQIPGASGHPQPVCVCWCYWNSVYVLHNWIYSSYLEHYKDLFVLNTLIRVFAVPL